MTVEHPERVDLDQPDPDDDEDNAAWAKRLFSPSRRAEELNDTAAEDPPHEHAAEPPGTATSQPPEQAAAAPAPPSPARPEPVDLSALTTALTDRSQASTDTDDEAKSPAAVWAAALGVLALVGGVAITMTMLVSGRDNPPPPKTHAVPTLAAGAPTIDPQAPHTAESADDIIPYHAEWKGCYDGSTDQQTLQQALQDTTSAATAVCVRGFGGAGGGTNGQQLHITLGNEMTGNRFYKVSRIKITPGWIPKIPGGKDEWAKHLVPKRVRYVLNPSSERPEVWDVDTGAARGPSPYVPAKPVLASEINVVILEAVRPPADIPATESTEASATALPTLDAGPDRSSDDTVTATDATFAISLLEVQGQVGVP